MNQPDYDDELVALWRRGEFAEMAEGRKRMLNEFAKRRGDTYPENATVTEYLARAYYDNGDFCAAAIELERTLQFHREHNNLPSEDAVRCLYLLGRCYSWTSRAAAAEQTLAEALTLLDHLPEEQQSGRGFVLVELAHMHHLEGRFDTAEQLLLRAIKPMLHHFGYGNRHFGFVYLHLAWVYEKQGRTTAADRAMEKCVRWLRFAIDEDDFEFSKVLVANGVRLQKRGRLEEARQFMTEALTMLERIRKPDHYMIERLRDRLAKVENLINSSTP